MQTTRDSRTPEPSAGPRPGCSSGPATSGASAGGTAASGTVADKLLIDLGDVPGMAKNGFGQNSPQFRSADAACRNLLPPGITDDGSGP